MAIDPVKIAICRAIVTLNQDIVQGQAVAPTDNLTQPENHPSQQGYPEGLVIVANFRTYP